MSSTPDTDPESVPSRVGGAILAGPRGEAVTAIFCEATRKGLPKRYAAAAAGISESTWQAWRRRGEAGEEPYATFLARVNEADAERASSYLEKLEGVALGELEGVKPADMVKALTWLLERAYPRDFGSAQKVELTGADGGPVRTETARPLFTDAQLAAMGPEELAAALGALGGEGDGEE